MAMVADQENLVRSIDEQVNKILSEGGNNVVLLAVFSGA